MNLPTIEFSEVRVRALLWIFITYNLSGLKGPAEYSYEMRLLVRDAMFRYPHLIDEYPEVLKKYFGFNLFELKKWGLHWKESHDSGRVL